MMLIAVLRHSFQRSPGRSGWEERSLNAGVITVGSDVEFGIGLVFYVITYVHELFFVRRELGMKFLGMLGVGIVVGLGQ